MQVKIMDIAANCGVSKALVSRIANQDPTLRCSNEVRQRVLDEIEKQGYIPNTHAKMLSSRTMDVDRKLFRLGYISYTSDTHKGHPYFDKISEGVISQVKKMNCELAFGMDISDAYRHYKQRLPLCDCKLDGIILFGEIQDDGLCGYITEQTKNIISICKQENRLDADFVGCDSAETIQLILNFIKEQNYKEIGLIVGTDDGRKKEAVSKVSELGLTLNQNYLLHGQYDTAKTYEMIKEKVKEFTPPKVICCLNDEMAIGCIRALMESGYKVPEDISVTGHDDILRANYFEVPLTTVRIYKEEIGKLAVAVLVEKISNKRKYSIKAIIPGKLVKRDSIIKYKQDQTNDKL